MVALLATCCTNFLILSSTDCSAWWVFMEFLLQKLWAEKPKQGAVNKLKPISGRRFPIKYNCPKNVVVPFYNVNRNKNMMICKMLKLHIYIFTYHALIIPHSVCKGQSQEPVLDYSDPGAPQTAPL